MKKVFMSCLIITVWVVLSSITYAEEKWVITHSYESENRIVECAIDVNNYRVLKGGDYIYYEKYIDYDQNYTEQHILISKFVIRRATHTAIETWIKLDRRNPLNGRMEPRVVDQIPKTVNYEEKGYANIRAAIQFLDELEAEK